MKQRLSGFWAACAAVVIAPLCVLATPGTTNVFTALSAYTEDFELNVGDKIFDLRDGWWGDTNSIAVVTNWAYEYSGGQPLGGTHANVLCIESQQTGYAPAVTNTLSGPAGVVQWLDFMAQLGQVEDTNNIPVDTQIQVAFFVYTNSHLYVYHNDRTGNNYRWSEFGQTRIESNQWRRISIRLAYDYADPYNPVNYFQIYLDGVALTNADGYSTNVPTGPETAPDGGSWLVLGYSAADRISALEIGGKGYLDDLVAQVTGPTFPSYTAKGTYIPWLVSYGLTPADDLTDYDNDGMYAWQEYVAGTDPTLGSSVFEITEQTILNGSNILRWVSSTLGANFPYAVARSSNMVNSAAWEWVATGIARKPDGETNEWGEALGPVPFYYRVVATNATP
jgi:hypothetical protein